MLFGAQVCAEGASQQGWLSSGLHLWCGQEGVPTRGDAVTWCQILMEQVDLGRMANRSGSDDNAFCNSDGGGGGLVGHSHLSALCLACFLSASFLRL